MQSCDQSIEAVGFEARRLLASANALCRSVEHALSHGDSDHAAILIAAGRRLVAHPAADDLIDSLDWRRARRRLAELAKKAQGSLSAEASGLVDRALELTMRGMFVQSFDLYARFSFDPPMELPPLDLSKLRIVSLGE